jgi:hypothetical protein
VTQFALEGALRAHRELGKEEDGEWAEFALAYLSSCASNFGKTRTPEADMPQDDQGGILKGVLQGLVDLREEIEGKGRDSRLSIRQNHRADGPAAEHAVFDVSLLKHDTVASDEADVSTLALQVTNRLLEVSYIPHPKNVAAC